HPLDLAGNRSSPEPFCSVDRDRKVQSIVQRWSGSCCRARCRYLNWVTSVIGALCKTLRPLNKGVSGLVCCVYAFGSCAIESTAHRDGGSRNWSMRNCIRHGYRG